MELSTGVVATDLLKRWLGCGSKSGILQSLMHRDRAAEHSDHMRQVSLAWWPESCLSIIRVTDNFNT